MANNKVKQLGNVIILNKPFLGGWLDKAGHIGHEIIDFFLADNGEYYVYNNPWGVCPDDIWVEGTPEGKKLDGKKITGQGKYVAKYLVLTSEMHEGEFNILYVIELCEKLHDKHGIKRKTKKEKGQDGKEIEIDVTDWKKLQDQQETVINEIIKDRIVYNGRPLNEIYGYDETLYVTFKAKALYKAKEPIRVKLKHYTYQRNKGYLYYSEIFTENGEEKYYTDDYKELLKYIDNPEANERFELYPLKTLKEQNIKPGERVKTFMDLIGFADNEQAYTNMLYSVLEQGNLFNKFCKEFQNKYLFDSETSVENVHPIDEMEQFEISRESKIVNGRMDICAESDIRRVIIENKVYSGLNGIRPADNETQLSTYYKWGKQKDGSEPLCLITLPDSRVDDIEREIKEYDRQSSGPKMAQIYRYVPYSEIAKFIGKNTCPQDYAYCALWSQIMHAFENLGQANKEDLYARMFLAATQANGKK